MSHASAVPDAFHVGCELLRTRGFTVPNGEQAHAHVWLRLSRRMNESRPLFRIPLFRMQAIPRMVANGGMCHPGPLGFCPVVLKN
jgi:hypothetical protein